MLLLSSLPSLAQLSDALPDLWLPDVDHTVGMAVTVAVAVSAMAAGASQGPQGGIVLGRRDKGQEGNIEDDVIDFRVVSRSMLDLC